jgi:hypothetical protein
MHHVEAGGNVSSHMPEHMRKLLLISTLLTLALPAIAHAEMGEAEAMATAINHAAIAGLTGPLRIQSSGQSTRARAQQVLEPGDSGGQNLTATAYPFVLSSGNGTTFNASAPVPHGRHLPAMRYLEVTISEPWTNETFSPNPISIAALGTVVTVNISSSEASTASRGCHVQALLTDALAARHLGARHARAVRSLRACEARHHQLA